MSGAIDTTPYALLSRALAELRKSLALDIEAAVILRESPVGGIEPDWRALDEAKDAEIFELAQLVCDIEDQLCRFRTVSPTWLGAFLRDFRARQAGEAS